MIKVLIFKNGYQIVIHSIMGNVENMARLGLKVPDSNLPLN